jgi:hypothetical protein
MTSQVSIVTSSAPNAVAVPIQAVLERTASGDEDDENAPKKKVVYLAKPGRSTCRRASVMRRTWWCSPVSNRATP